MFHIIVVLLSQSQVDLHEQKWHNTSSLHSSWPTLYPTCKLYFCTCKDEIGSSLRVPRNQYSLSLWNVQRGKNMTCHTSIGATFIQRGGKDFLSLQTFSSKVYQCYLGTFLNLTLDIWLVCGLARIKEQTLKIHMFKGAWMTSSKFINYFALNSEHNWRLIVFN
jgi:hypothetical protein